MDPLLIVIIVVLTFIVTFVLVRPKPKSQSSAARKGFRMVTEAQAQQRPYPYVMVNDDGSVRELTAAERTYLETPFSPFDGGRPYTKTTYADRTVAGKQGGFLERSQVPKGTPISPA